MKTLEKNFLQFNILILTINIHVFEKNLIVNFCSNLKIKGRLPTYMLFIKLLNTFL
jgi:hypothetical protein